MVWRSTELSSARDCYHKSGAMFLNQPAPNSALQRPSTRELPGRERAESAELASVRRHRVSTSRSGLVPLKPDGERLVAYLERRTPWDS